MSANTGEGGQRPPASVHPPPRPDPPPGSHVDAEDGDGDGDGGGGAYDPSLPPLDLRVVAAVRSCPPTASRGDGGRPGYRAVRPARLASELGMSVEDATAELCGLLGAVGGGEGGAEFRFEEEGGRRRVDDDGAGGGGKGGAGMGRGATMVFVFPPDFERRALRRRRTESVRAALWSFLDFSVRLIKVAVAFGLIVSLAVLSVASICAMVAALILLARGGGDHGGGGGGGHRRAEIVRRIRSLFFTLRQLLWCYALFGPGLEGGQDQDPFLHEVAGNLALMLGLCCGNPGNIFFLWRLSMLNRRRRRWGRGWGGRYGGRWGADESPEGASLIREGEWGREGGASSWADRSRGSSAAASAGRTGGSDAEGEGHRGLLSVAVEFLFGPVPFWPGPDEADRWRLRARAIIALSTSNVMDETPKEGVSLEELAPYADRPPASSGDQAAMVAEGLAVVAHFNGRPAPPPEGDAGAGPGGASARFVFPELMAESERGGLSLFSESTRGDDEFDTSDSNDNLLYVSNPQPFTAGEGRALGGAVPQAVASPVDELPAAPRCLRERRHVLTKLSPKQFGQCCLLGALNLLGVLWLRRSVGPGGLLRIENRPLFRAADAALGVLQFYAKMFFALPLGRLGLIVGLNRLVDGRNRRRRDVAERLEAR